MTLYELITVLVVITALFGYLNSRTLRLPTTAGIMLNAMLVSLILVAADAAGLDLGHAEIRRMLARIDFHQVLLDCMLAFLLFAGALHIRLDDLMEKKWQVAFLSTAALLVSAAVIGLLVWWMLGAIGIPTPLVPCLAFGALISPTDPVAVLGILKRARIPKPLETKIAGEALFNDGVGAVAFIALLGSESSGLRDAVGLFATNALGGALFGFAIGALASRMLRRLHDYQVEILITLALVMGGYLAAERLHLSGPLAIVVAGLHVANCDREKKSRAAVEMFWDLVDGIMNSLLFLLIGLEIQVMAYKPAYLLAGACGIVIVLFGRWLSIVLSAVATGPAGGFGSGAIRVMTWSGLRGGISVALALSLPAGETRELLVVMTFMSVVFSVFVQGLTLESFVRWVFRRQAERPAP